MKRISILIAILSVLLSMNSFGKKWRVNNISHVNADTTSLAGAIKDLAQAGDTIYVEASSTSYGTIDITKPLTIIGTGYYLPNNPQTQANRASSIVDNIDFENGSAGSAIMGLTVAASIDIFTNNIIIKRNWIKSQGIDVEGVSNIIISQNYIQADTYNSYYAIDIMTGSSGIIVHNNIIVHKLLPSGTATNYFAITMDAGTAAEITNNVIIGNLQLSLANFANNIWIKGLFTKEDASSIYQNNMCDTAQLSGTENFPNVDMSTVFDTECATCKSPDGKYQIIADGPASGKGVGSYDLGAFGGVEPYVLSGLPPIPTIYYYSGPSSGSQESGLPVTVKVRSVK